MKNEVKPIVDKAEEPMTSGQAFQLSAATTQQLSALHLSFGEAKHLIDNPRLLKQKIRRGFCDQPTTSPVPLRKYCVLQDAEIPLERSTPDWANRANLKEMLTYVHVQGLDDFPEKTYPCVSLEGRLFHCTVSAAATHGVTWLREILGHDGPDTSIGDMLKMREVLWSVYGVCELIRREYNNSEDPLGLAEFEGEQQAVFPVELPSEETVARGRHTGVRANDEPKDVGLMYVRWCGYFRKMRRWHVVFTPHTFLQGPSLSTIFLRNDPRRIVAK